MKAGRLEGELARERHRPRCETSAVQSAVDVIADRRVVPRPEHDVVERYAAGNAPRGQKDAERVAIAHLPALDVDLYQSPLAFERVVLVGARGLESRKEGPVAQQEIEYRGGVGRVVRPEVYAAPFQATFGRRPAAVPGEPRAQAAASVLSK